MPADPPAPSRFVAITSAGERVEIEATVCRRASRPGLYEAQAIGIYAMSDEKASEEDAVRSCVRAVMLVKPIVEVLRENEPTRSELIAALRGLRRASDRADGELRDEGYHIESEVRAMLNNVIAEADRLLAACEGAKAA